MAMPGTSSVCFTCGQPLPKDIGTAAMPAPPPAVQRPAFPLTSALEASQLAPPPNPYLGASPQTPGASPQGPGYARPVATSASILGASGTFAIKAGGEVKVGRDPATCPITLTDPKVSGNHATLKFEGGQLLVRDDGSNNGTHIDGVRIPAHVWTPVAPNVRLRFGPVEFGVRIE